MTIEQKLKDLIISRYDNIVTFTKSIGKVLVGASEREITWILKLNSIVKNSYAWR